MNLIKDIRLFETLKENIDGESLPSYIGKIYHLDESKLSTYILRILFLLRHNQFSLGDFDHLYLNFTPVIEHESMVLSDRSINKEEKWFRYVDVGCNIEIFNSWDEKSKNNFIINMIIKALKVFSSQNVGNYYKDILDENIHFHYKEKAEDKYLIQVMVKIINYSKLIPIVKVYENNLLKKEIILDEMSKDKFILQFSSITIGKNTFNIKPRINSISKFYNVIPLKYDLE